MICQAIEHGQLSQKLTCKFLQKQDDWNDWKESKSDQLDSYHSLAVLGEPCQIPQDVNVNMDVHKKNYVVQRKRNGYVMEV